MGFLEMTRNNRHLTTDLCPCQLVTDLLRRPTCRLCCGLLTELCYGETGVMDFGHRLSGDEARRCCTKVGVIKLTRP